MEESGTVGVGDGVQIAYILRGPKREQVLLFCPGLGATQLGYAADASYFAAEGRRTLTFDVRGSGRSSRPLQIMPESFSVARLVDDVVGLLDGLAIQRVDVVGHSLGGVVGLELVSRVPSRVRSLITYGTTYQIASSWLLWFVLALISWAIGSKRLAALAARTATTYNHARPTIRAMLSDYPVSVSNRIRRGIRRYDYRSVAVSWAGPILLIRGAHDREINSKLGPTLAALEGNPNFHLADLEGAGHFANVERPEAFRQLVARFLERLDGYADRP